MSSTRPTTRIHLPRPGLVLIAIAFLLAGCGHDASDHPRDRRASPATALREVSVRFPIPIVESGQASFYLGEDRGYYAREGLKITWQMGSKELNPIKTVVAGTDAFGIIGGPDALIVARSKSQPVKALAVLHRNSNFSCLLTLKASGITRVEQLDKKQVGFYYGHISTDVLRALFKQVGVHPEEVDVGFDYSQFLSGRLDAQWAFTVTAGLDLPAKGVAVNIISPADYGIITHGYTIFTTDQLAERDPTLVTAFLRASLAGVRDAVASPEAATDALLRRDPKLDRTLNLARQLKYNAVTSASAEYPAGFMNAAMFEDTYRRLADLGVLTTPFNVTDVYTTRFLDEARANEPPGH
jgi:NitT/TauT family transport system substrate-binding protein